MVIAELYVDLIPPRRHANRLTDLDEVEFRAPFRNSSVCKRYMVSIIYGNMVSMTISSIDMNIHVYAKLAGHDVM